MLAKLFQAQPEGLRFFVLRHPWLVTKLGIPVHCNEMGTTQSTLNQGLLAQAAWQQIH